MSMSLKAVRQVASKTTSAQIYGASSSISRSLGSQTYSTEANTSSESSQDKQVEPATKPTEEIPKVHKKTQLELDKELELKMQGLAGDGGESGVELEDGQPTAMKRSVRNNMFRYI